MELTRTINFRGVFIDVSFDYQPDEIEDGLVKFAAEIDITDVIHKNESIMSFFECVSEIEEEIVKHI